MGEDANKQGVDMGVSELVDMDDLVLRTDSQRRIIIAYVIGCVVGIAVSMFLMVAAAVWVGIVSL